MSHRAATKVNADVASKDLTSEAEPPVFGRRQQEAPSIGMRRRDPPTGWKRQHGDKDMLSNWRDPPRPEASLGEG